MLTGRSVLIVAIVVAVLSLLGALISLLQPPDRNGLGMDTYGTRAQGYRAVFDTLEALDFDVQRALGPPSEAVDKSTTLVLWGPQTDMVQIEPVYLQRLRQWVRSGGRLIVAPEAQRDTNNETMQPAHRSGLVNFTNVLKELGLPEIETKVVDLPTANGGTPNGNSTILKQSNRSSADNRNSDGFKADLDRYLFPTLFPTTTVKVQTAGGLRELAPEVSRLEVPSSVQVLDLDMTKPDGQISLVFNQDRPSGDSASSVRQLPPIFAAQLKLGAGEVIVVGDPALLDNRLFSQADNAVLAVDLLGKPKQTIVWDEFYHGLTVRGNPLFLLTRSYYGLVAAMIGALTALWVWRRSIFLGPPLADPAVARRTLAEYVAAMANFFHRGSGSLRFMLGELRRGVLWSLRGKYGSPREQTTVEDIAAAVARRDPQAARKLLDAMAKADLLLTPTHRAKPREILQAAKDLVDCR